MHYFHLLGTYSYILYIHYRVVFGYEWAFEQKPKVYKRHQERDWGEGLKITNLSRCWYCHIDAS